MSSSNNAINNTVGATISGVTNTMTIQNPSNTASSVAQVLLTVGGTSSGSPWMQWTVGTTESFALGQNNSQTQKLYLTYNNSASVSPTTGTTMLFYDQTVPGLVLGASQYIVFNTSALAVGTVSNNGISIYELGTFTPTLVGGSTAGSTTYSNQTGVYVRNGDYVDTYCQIDFSAATGTGDARLGNLPFALNSSQNGAWGSVELNGNTWNWPASRTQMNWFGQANQTYGTVNCIGSTQTQSNLQMTNAGTTFFFSMFYRV